MEYVWSVQNTAEHRTRTNSAAETVVITLIINLSLLKVNAKLALMVSYLSHLTEEHAQLVPLPLKRQLLSTNLVVMLDSSETHQVLASNVQIIPVYRLH